MWYLPLPVDLYYGAAILIFAHKTLCYQTEAGRKNSLVPSCAMTVSIHNWYLIQGTIPRWWLHDTGRLVFNLLWKSHEKRKRVCSSTEE